MRAIFLAILVIFSNLSYSLSPSRQIVVADKNADDSLFRSFLRASPQLRSYSEYSYSLTPHSEARKALIAAFERAQSSYFNAERDVAINHFRDVLKMQTKEIWKPEDARLFVTAALRSAELSESETEKNEFLQIAVNWSTQIKINKSTFAPPLVAEFNNVKSFTQKSALKLNKNFEGFELLVSRNQSFNIANSKEIQLLPGKQLVRLYSSKFQYQEKVLAPDDINSWTPQKISLSSGSCNSAKVINPLENTISYVFFNKNCISNINQSVPISQLMPQPKHMRPSRSNFDSQTSRIQFQKKEPWWKNKWLWVGVAGAGAAYMIYENNRDSGSNNQDGPTTVVYE